MKWMENSKAGDEWVRVVGGRALVPTNDYVGRSMKYFGDLDPKVSAIVDKCVSPGDVCLDIGANLGLVSLRMSDRVGPLGLVHAFEPQPRMQSYLKRTMDENGIKNIKLHGIALGEEKGTLPLSIPKSNAGSASFVEDRGSQAEKIDVPVHRLTEFMKELGVGSVSFIKIDVEGFESLVIKGGMDFLREARPNAIILEEHKTIQNNILPECLQLLIGLGYDLYAMPKVYFRVRLEAKIDSVLCHDYVAVSGAAPHGVRSKLGIE
ncbi:MAG: FkbM family methyltransferase [Roseobacter sp.]